MPIFSIRSNEMHAKRRYFHRPYIRCHPFQVTILLKIKIYAKAFTRDIISQYGILVKRKKPCKIQNRNRAPTMTETARI